MSRKTSAPSIPRNVSSDPESSRLRCVLVPVDLTPGSDRVLGRLSRLPLAADARITLLHVVPGGLLPRERKKVERDAHEALADEVRDLRKHVHDDLQIEPLVKLGTAAREITACATEVQPELIVMGRGSGRVLRDAFLGSTAERVVRQSQRPVLVVRLRARAAYRHPTLALDLDQAAYDVVRLLLRVLPPRPLVEVVHAFDSPYRDMLYPSLSKDEAARREHKFQVIANEQLRKLLTAAVTKANVRPDEGPLWTTHVRLGPPRLVVEKAMAKAETDLLVVGTHGYSGAALALLGTVAGDLLRAAKCDVLVVPPAAT